jgi:hypothetical protein
MRLAVLAVTPRAGLGIERVQAQEAVPVLGDELDRVHDEPGLGIVHRVVEAPRGTSRA